MISKENGWFIAILLSYFASSSLSSLANQSFVYHPVIWLGGGVALIALLSLKPSKITTLYILLASALGSIGAHEWGLMISKQEIDAQTYIMNAVGLGLAEVVQIYLIYKLIILFKVDYKSLVNVRDVFGFFIVAILTGTGAGLALKGAVVTLHWEVYGSGIMTTDYFSWFIAELLSVFVSSILFLSIYYRKTELWNKRLLEVCLPVMITYFFVSILSIVACPTEREGAFFVQQIVTHIPSVSGCKVAGAGVAFNFTLLITLLLLSGRAFISENALKRNATEVNDINKKLHDTLHSSWLMNSELMTQGKIANIAANSSFHIAQVKYVVIVITANQGSQFFGYPLSSYLPDRAKNDPSAEVEDSLYNDAPQAGVFYSKVSLETEGLTPLDISMYGEDEKVKGYLTVFHDKESEISINDIALLKTIAISAGVAAKNLNMLLTEKENSSRLMQSDTVINTANEGIFIVDHQFHVAQINPSFTNITGYTKKDVMGKALYKLKAHKVTAGLFSLMRDSLASKGKWEGELLNCRHKTGGDFSVRLSITAVDDGMGGHYYAGVFSDITSFKESAEKLQYQADHDDLTGLANRKRFNRELKASLEHASKREAKCGVLYIDLDKFKQVNDNMGHQAGDELLIQVSERLRSCVRESDLISRLGGDEFAIILKTIKTVEAIERVAEKILDELNRPFSISGGNAFISGSIGMSVYPDHGKDHVELLRFADSAMYETKRDGRNGFKAYAPEMSEQTSKRYEIENDLRQAFEKNEFELYFQPQAVIYDDRLVGLEALIRWNHPKKGLIPPIDFLGVAEEAGFMNQLDSWVLDEGFRQLREWEDKGIAPERLSLNISGVQITDQNFTTELSSLIERHGISPGGIELEISENFVMRHATRAIEILNEIKVMGFHLSIDDFGTGYSSLSYLKKLPIDTLKIDGSFVRDVMDDQDDASIAIAIITLAHNMRMRVIAEGVETQGQKDFLMEHDSDIYQGYLYSRPVTQSAITEVLIKAKLQQDQ